MVGKIPQLNTNVSLGVAQKAPTVSLATPSSTQIPVYVVNAVATSAGEEPLYLVRMRDGTYAYIKESLLTQDGGMVKV